MIGLKSSNGVIEPICMDKARILPSISYAEIKYLVFGVPSTDYHNELYGHLMENIFKVDSIKECNKLIRSELKKYPNKSELEKHVKVKEKGVTEMLPTYIRNAIHHSENKTRNYTPEDLRKSIGLLEELCKSKF